MEFFSKAKILFKNFHTTDLFKNLITGTFPQLNYEYLPNTSFCSDSFVTVFLKSTVKVIPYLVFNPVNVGVDLRRNVPTRNTDKSMVV